MKGKGRIYRINMCIYCIQVEVQVKYLVRGQRLTQKPDRGENLYI